MFKHELAMGGGTRGARGRRHHRVRWLGKMIYDSAYAGAHTHGQGCQCVHTELTSLAAKQAGRLFFPFPPLLSFSA